MRPRRGLEPDARPLLGPGQADPGARTSSSQHNGARPRARPGGRSRRARDGVARARRSSPTAGSGSPARSSCRGASAWRAAATCPAACRAYGGAPGDGRLSGAAGPGGLPGPGRGSAAAAESAAAAAAAAAAGAARRRCRRRCRRSCHRPGRRGAAARRRVVPPAARWCPVAVRAAVVPVAGAALRSWRRRCRRRGGRRRCAWRRPRSWWSAELVDGRAVVPGRRRGAASCGLVAGQDLQRLGHEVVPDDRREGAALDRLRRCTAWSSARACSGSRPTRRWSSAASSRRTRRRRSSTSCRSCRPRRRRRSPAEVPVPWVTTPCEHVVDRLADRDRGMTRLYWGWSSDRCGARQTLTEQLIWAIPVGPSSGAPSVGL